MTKEQWLQDALPPGIHRLTFRYVPPELPERTACAFAAAHFARGVQHFADRLPETHPEATDLARATAAAAAVLQNYLQLSQKHTWAPAAPDGDPTPEALRASQQMDAAWEISRSITEDARRAMEAQGLLDVPPPTPRPFPPDPEEMKASNSLYHQRQALANSAMAAGHAAALHHLMDAMQEEARHGRRPPVLGGITLAMWPHEDALAELRKAPMDQECVPLATEAFQRILTECLEVNDYRPTYATPLASHAMHDGTADDMLSQMNMGPSAPPSFHWDETDGPDNPGPPLMLYRHQGSNHLKLVSEPYTHRIDIQEVLSHCAKLEDDVIAIYEPEFPEGNDALNMRRLLSAAAAGRTMALLMIHNRPTHLAHRALELARDHGHPSQARALAEAIFDDQAQAVADAATAARLNHPPLTQEQAAAALRAAREAGATDASLTRAAHMLGALPRAAEALGLPEPQPIPWDQAQEIIRNTCFTDPPTPDHRWERVCRAIGWDAEDPKVRDLRREFVDLYRNNRPLY